MAALHKTNPFGYGPRSDFKRGSKVDQVYLALRRAIAAGEMQPGTPIDKVELCQRFDVSRLSVTSAINRLAFDRFVIIEPQRGSYVARMNLRDARQWMLVRRAIEVELVGVGARDLSDQAVARLGHNLAYQRAAMEAKDLQGFHDLDTQFHDLFIQELKLQRVGEILDPVRTHLDRIRRTLLPEPGRIGTTFAEHQAIYERIAARDIDGSRAAMAAHLDRVFQEMRDFARRHPDFFES